MFIAIVSLGSCRKVILPDAVSFATATVTMASLASINDADDNSLNINGTCSEEGREVTVDVGGITPVIQPTCTLGVWNVVGLDVSALPDGPVPIIINHVNKYGIPAPPVAETPNKDVSAPTVTIDQGTLLGPCLTAQVDPDSDGAICYDVFFNESITGFSNADITATKDGGALPGGATVSVTGSGANYAVTIFGIATDGSDDGIYQATVNAAGAQDLAGNNCAASTSTDNSIGHCSAGAGPTYRVNLDSSEVEANNSSFNPSISADGRYVVFDSFASNLVAGDTNGSYDIFLRDRQLGTTTRVSVDSFGVEGNNDSQFPSISADGVYVVFESAATNLDLIVADTNGRDDVFIHNTITGITERVSIHDNDVTQGNQDSSTPVVSDDGRYVAFRSLSTNFDVLDVNGQNDIYLRDRTLNSTTLISSDAVGNSGNNQSYDPDISADGRFIIFRSGASNLGPVDGNGVLDVYLWDQVAQSMELVSVDSLEVIGNAQSWNASISADGRFVAFQSDANNLVGGDTNFVSDIFVRDHYLGVTYRVSLTHLGGETNNHSTYPSISTGGRFVTFESIATNLVAGDTNARSDIFVRDRALNTTERISVDSAGAESNNNSYLADFSDDGRFVAFHSNADNLVCNDSGTTMDIFVRDLQPAGFTVTLEQDAGQVDPAAAGPILFDAVFSTPINIGSFTSGDIINLGTANVTAWTVAHVSGGVNFDVRAVSLASDGTVIPYIPRASVDDGGGLFNYASTSVDATVTYDGTVPAVAIDQGTLLGPCGATQADPESDSNICYDVVFSESVTGFTNTDVTAQKDGGALPGGASVVVAGSGTDYTVTIIGLATDGSEDGVYTATIGAGGATDGVNTNAASTSTDNSVTLTTGCNPLVGTVLRYTLDTTENESTSPSYAGGTTGFNVALSNDARFVAFEAFGDDFDPGDTNGLSDIYLRDRNTDATSRISVNTVGGDPNGNSTNPGISSDGRYVVYQSTATNIVAGDTNGQEDIFVRDTFLNTSTRVNVDDLGNQANGAPSDGAMISGNGRYVVFSTASFNLVPADSNGVRDIFVRDMLLNTTERVSVSSLGAQATNESFFPFISYDGRFVSFESTATNLVVGDTNGQRDIFVRDRTLGTTERVSVDSGELEANGFSNDATISDNGRFIAFQSAATNLVAGDSNGFQDIFVRDQLAGTTTRISVDTGAGDSNLNSFSPHISSDGRFVSFESDASDLVAGDTNASSDAFLRDLSSNTTTRISVDGVGAEGNGDSYTVRLSDDARYAVFNSKATNLTCDDTNSQDDAFVRDLQTTGINVTIEQDGGQADPVGALPIVYDVLFAAPIVPGTFTPSDISNIGTADVTTWTITEEAPLDGTTFTIRATVVATDGTVIPFLSRASVDDGGGVFNYASTSVDATVTYDGTQPTVTIDQGTLAGPCGANQADPESDGDICYDVIFSESVTGFTNADVTAQKDGGALPGGASVVVGGSGTDYTVTITGLATDGSEDGVYTATVNAGGATDGVNTNAASTSTDNAVTLTTCNPLIGPTFRLSLDSAENEASAGGSLSSIDETGRYISFGSGSSDLVAGDTNFSADIFVRDFTLETTTRTSVDSLGNQGTGGTALTAKISGNGRYTVFRSTFTNLVAGDTNGVQDIFVHDSVTGVTERVSVDSLELEANAASGFADISYDGRYVVFSSAATNLVAGDTNGFTDIFVRDRTLGTTVRITNGLAGAEPDANSGQVSISDDGRFVAFQSYADNLVAGDSGTEDVFVFDMLLGTTELASVSSAEVKAWNNSSLGEISADGNFVTFYTIANNLVAGDTNGTWDVFVRDRAAGTTDRVSVDSLEVEATGGLSRYSSISKDGRYVVFVSGATNLIVGDTNGVDDIFLRDRVLGTTERISINSADAEANNYSDFPYISDNGRYVTFGSLATNMVCGDTNGTTDVFLRDLQTTGINVTIEQDGAQVDPTNTTPIVYDVVFAAPIVPGTFTPSDVSNVGTASGITWTVTEVAPFDGTTFDLQAVIIGNDGTVIPHLSRGSVDNGGGIFNYASTSVDATVEYDVTAPSVTVEQGLIGGPCLVNQSDPEIDSTICFDVVFSEAVTGFTNADVTAQKDGGALPGGASVVVAGSDARYSVTITGLPTDGSEDGVYTATVPAGGATDGFNLNLVSTSTDNSVSLLTCNPLTGPTYRVSLSSAEIQGDNSDYYVDASFDGRYIVFGSDSTNLVAGDTNGSVDVFLRDFQTDTTTRVSVDSLGAQASGNSSAPSITSDGRYVVFYSDASDLVAGDTNGNEDIFVRDTVGGTTVRASLTHLGGEGDANSSAAVISNDGRYVVFQSLATNLVAGDGNGFSDIFIRDLINGTTDRVSLTNLGGEANGPSYNPSVSSDGLYVVFSSSATNLVAGDTNGVSDIFIRDIVGGSTERISVDSLGAQATGTSFTPSISGNAQYVAFSSNAADLVVGDSNGVDDVFVRDRFAGTTVRVSLTHLGGEANGQSQFAFISDDGRFVHFESGATDLVVGDTNGLTDSFVRDRTLGTTVRVSVDSSGAESNGNVIFGKAITGDGRYALFGNDASNLVCNDTNGSEDIFMRDLQTSGITVTLEQDGGQADPINSLPIIFDVVFAAPIVPATFTSADIIQLGTAIVTAWTVTEVGPMDGTTFEVRATGVITDGTVQPFLGRGLVDDGGGNFNYAATSVDGVVVYDTSAPTVTIDQGLLAGPCAANQADPENDSDICYDVIFSESVTGFTNTDVTAQKDGGALPGGASVVVAGSGTDYTVTITGLLTDGADDGVYTAIIPAGGATDGVNTNDASTSTDNSITLDATDPTVTVEKGAVGGAGTCNALQADPENDSDICYDITFNESVSGFVIGDVTATYNGGALPGGITPVFAGSGSVYTYTLTGIATDTTEDGDYVVTVGAGVAADAATNTNAASTSTDNDVEIDTTAPTVTIDQGSGQSDPDTNGSISYDVVFSEPVTGFTNADVTVTKDGGAPPVGMTILVTGAGALYAVTLNGLAIDTSDDGVYVATVDASAAQDVATNNSAASTSTDNSVTLDTSCNQTLGPLYRASLVNGGLGEGDLGSFQAVTSADGRYVAFNSFATNLVAGDTNATRDIFLRDTVTDVTTRVSVDSVGTEADAMSQTPAISADGRFIVFNSSATNLVAGDINGVNDIFIHHRLTGTTERVSLTNAGGEANGQSYQPHISFDGRFVVFISSATNLVTGDTNGVADAFVRDRLLGTTVRVSVNSTGAEINNSANVARISESGRYISFYSHATDVVVDDTNGNADVFLHDRITGITERVSVSTAGAEGDDHSDGYNYVSPDGHYVVFDSRATNLIVGDTNASTDVFIRDRQLGTTERVSLTNAGGEANGSSDMGFMSPDARFIAFRSQATDIVAGDTNGTWDVFMRDRVAGTTKKMSTENLGAEGDSYSTLPHIALGSSDVVFSSNATTLMCNDANAQEDVFTRNIQSPTAFPGIAVTIDQAGAQADPANSLPVVFDLVFASFVNVFEVTSADVVNLGTATVDTWSVVHAGGNNYTVSATAVSKAGTIVPYFMGQSAGNGIIYNYGSTSTDNVVEYIIDTNCNAIVMAQSCPNSCTAPEIAGFPYAAGTGTSGDPFVICTAAQFNEIGNNLADWNSHFQLKADIDLSGFPGETYNVIGNIANPFTGVMDGQGCAVSNLNYIDASFATHLGLFGVNQCAYIHDLELANVNISGRSYAGALAGVTVKGRYENIDWSSGSTNGEDIVGGLIGATQDLPLTFNNIRANGDAYNLSLIVNSATGGLIGDVDNYIYGPSSCAGLAGGNYQSAVSEFVIDNTKVCGGGSVDSAEGGYAGGMIGYLSFNAADTHRIENSYVNKAVYPHSAGTVGAPLDVRAGGLVGTVAGNPGGILNVDNVATSGTIEFDTTVLVTIGGGLVAANSTTVNITNSYSNMTIDNFYFRGGGLANCVVGVGCGGTSGANLGGLVGNNGGTTAIDRSYFSGTIYGEVGAGGLVGDAGPAFANLTIDNSFVVGTFFGSGAIIGSDLNANGVLNNNFWDDASMLALPCDPDNARAAGECQDPGGGAAYFDDYRNLPMGTGVAIGDGTGNTWNFDLNWSPMGHLVSPPDLRLNY